MLALELYFILVPLIFWFRLLSPFYRINHPNYIITFVAVLPNTLYSLKLCIKANLHLWDFSGVSFFLAVLYPLASVISSRYSLEILCSFSLNVLCRLCQRICQILCDATKILIKMQLHIFTRLLNSMII